MCKPQLEILEDRQLLSVIFFLNPGNDPAGDLNFQANLASFTEFDIESLTAPVNALEGKPQIIDVNLINSDGTVASPVVDIFRSDEFVTRGTIYRNTLANSNPERTVQRPHVEFIFSEPAEGFGLWIFDDQNTSAEQFVMHVLQADGTVHTSEVLDSGNGHDHAVEGFLGVVSSLGIVRVVLEQQDLDGNPRTNPTAPFEIDHIQVGRSISRPDIAAISLFWNAAQGGVNLGYNVSGQDLPADTTFALYWATGPTAADILGGYAVSAAARTAVGSYNPIHVSAALLGPPREGATHLLFITDPDNLIAEADEGNNLLALELPVSPGGSSLDLWAAELADVLFANTRKVGPRQP